MGIRLLKTRYCGSSSLISTLRMYKPVFPSQAESELHGIRLAEQSERLQEAEKRSEERGQRVEELQRLLARMEVESCSLKDKMVADEAELLQLKAGGQKSGADERR